MNPKELLDEVYQNGDILEHKINFIGKRLTSFEQEIVVALQFFAEQLQLANSEIHITAYISIVVGSVVILFILFMLIFIR